MKLLLLSILLFTNPDWTNYQPNETFKIGRFYQNPYTEIIYVAGTITKQDGSLVLILEDIQGRYCKTVSKVCAISPDTKKGVWFEIKLISS